MLPLDIEGDYFTTSLCLSDIDYLVGIPLREQIKAATNISTTLASAYGLVDGKPIT